MSALLQVEAIETHIGQYHILQGVTFEVQTGHITVLLGRNGAGKTTTLRSIMGLSPVTTGTITLSGERLEALPTHLVARKGIGYVPEDQGVFYDLTVSETLRVAMRSQDEASQERLEWALELFPDLSKLWNRKSGLLSGGQKQMLAIVRAYVNDNRLLLIDEPSKGLAPIMVEKLMEALMQMKEKTTVLLVEQNFMMASQIGERYYMMDEGRVVRGGSMVELRDDEEARRKYLGIA
ncbi:ABC transporter ATP-binding protein [Paenibacillus sp. 481]|uniref:ABC transporter ATP-binding protein n=1 Tax=Paenibacillus sp. 481 TaxID=2835869 RepID=UPI001E36F160|nr:ABC transporter ATP-binding protein [Paenibacillus sp. 481]UHA74621.1 ABC transporter ATP-binding protein [Paenibacillus sp. 481]